MNFRKAIFATLATAFVMMFAALPSFAVPDPLNCTGYPEPRTFLESQSWWEQTEGLSGTEYGHVDIGTCFPWAQTLTGKVDFDVRVTLYDEPGTLSTVELQLFGSKSGKIIAKTSNINKKCVGDEACTLWFHLSGDTAQYPVDGRQEFRFHAIVKQPDGKSTMPSTGWQAYLKNGYAKKDYRSSDDFLEGRGWYTGEGYTIARLTTPLPKGPISGVWTAGVKMAPGSGGRPVTQHYAMIDPCFTCEPETEGTVLKEGAGSFSGKINIDTRWLSNGPHTLVLRSDAPSKTGSTLSGLIVIPFVVKN
jgi:hypothetical protein